MIAWVALSCSDTSARATDVETDDVAAWLEANAVVLDDPQRLATGPDLEPIRHLVGDARIVALGEATHGAREFFSVKHRMVRFLVEEMDFTIVAMEADWPEGQRLDRWVNGEPGDVERLVAGLYLWPWITEEVVAVLRWMREHNSGGPTRTLRFQGLDVQFGGMARAVLLEYLAQEVSGEFEGARGQLSCLEGHVNGPDGRVAGVPYSDLSEDEARVCRSQIDSVVDLVSRLASGPSASPADGAPAAHDYALHLQRFEDASRWREREGRTRDYWMAENALRLLEEGGPDTKIVFWAHNGHAGVRPGSAGARLRLALGTDLWSAGFAFDRGSFNAIDFTDPSHPLRAVTVGPAPVGSWAGHLRRGPHPLFGLSMRRPVADQPPWMRRMPHREWGCCFSGEGEVFADLRTEFDFVFFVESTTPTTLLTAQPPSDFR